MIRVKKETFPAISKGIKNLTQGARKRGRRRPLTKARDGARTFRQRGLDMAKQQNGYGNHFPMTGDVIRATRRKRGGKR
jgi:hypothetical protein